MLLHDLGVEWNKAIDTNQDNQSTIIIASKKGNFKRTKHLLIKDAFVKEQIAMGNIRLKYLPTDYMLADILTKPLSSNKLQSMLRRMDIRLSD